MFWLVLVTKIIQTSFPLVLNFDESDTNFCIFVVPSWREVNASGQLVAVTGRIFFQHYDIYYLGWHYS